jgi:hypothetical protein
MALAGNQQPVTGTYRDASGMVWAYKAQPLAGADASDGTRTSRATKVADNAWHPFTPTNETQIVTAAPATRLSTTADDTAVIAAGLAKV